MTSYEIILYIMSSHMRIVDTNLFDIIQETESKVGILLHVWVIFHETAVLPRTSPMQTLLRSIFCN